jgi:hypothetical protein
MIQAVVHLSVEAQRIGHGGIDVLTEQAIKSSTTIDDRRATASYADAFPTQH